MFGRIKPYEEVPIKQYLENIGFRNLDGILNDLFLNGDNIQNGYVTKRDFDERCCELYKDKIDCIFHKAPIDKSYEQNNKDIFHYKYGLYDYLKGIYPLFKEIIKTEVTPDLFTAVPNILDEDTKLIYYARVFKFILAIKNKMLRQGRRIDRYIKDLPLISPLIMLLIKKQKEHFYLKNSDINSLDYKLALLSCFQFFNEDNAKLFELKMLKWGENAKQS